ncbi:MAG TPA: hypothetical protein VFH69_09680 [Gemmatimonadota bacterium]|nr:hypothetical protein [Gemmatimonadota bacterium]
MRIGLAFVLLSLWVAAGCESGSPESGPSPDDQAARDSAAEDGSRRVVLRTGPLYVERDEGGATLTQVAAGTLLRIVPDASGGEDWVRVATWDDRQGWIPASRLVEPGLWAHYGKALGGVSPILLRPAYPVEEDRWAVEAPLDSPGLTPASTAWVLGDSARSVRVVAIDSFENICGGDRYRFGTLDAAAAADAEYEYLPYLDGGVLAGPSGARPTARRLPVGPLEPDRALDSLARRVARGLGPVRAGEPLAPESIEWKSLGGNAAWAAVSWPVADPATGQAQLAAALLFRRGEAGWEQLSAIAPIPSSAEIPTPAWRPVAAYSTGASAGPTLLLVEAFEYEGAHLDIWIERGDGLTRIHEGYYWGC